jgi:hypothetical protein
MVKNSPLSGDFARLGENPFLASDVIVITLLAPAF